MLPFWLVELLMSNTVAPALKTLLHSLDENQAIDAVVFDVRDHTPITDHMVICGGRSSRQVKAIAEHAIEQMKAKGYLANAVSGLQTAEWVLVDFGDVILHVMQPDTRAFYNLEGLWQSPTE